VRSNLDHFNFHVKYSSNKKYYASHRSENENVNPVTLKNIIEFLIKYTYVSKKEKSFQLDPIPATAINT